MMWMTWQRALRDVTILFLCGLAVGTVMRIGGILPALRWQPATAVVPTQATGLGLRPASDVTSLSPSATQPIDAPLSSIPLLGDGDTARDALRRSVIITARQALFSPCDADTRIAYQITLRDYSRAFSSAPASFRTTLDSEVSRAVALSQHAGLIDPVLVERWRSTERAGLASLLASQGLALGTSATPPCRNG